MEKEIASAVALLREADGIVIAAGAGMGVDSGLPDFRGDQGFWQAYPPLAHAGIRFVEIANPAAFRHDPRLAWGFYGHRLALYRATVPHAGFDLLRQMAARMAHGGFVFTSNVDGQFQKAGFADEQVAECHGSIHFLQCSQPCTDAIWPADGFSPQVDMAQCRLLSELPRCPHCGEVARPNILMFNDGAWLEQRSELQLDRLARWLQLARKPVVIELGAGVDVPSVRRQAERLGAPLVRINPRAPQGADVGLAMGALPGLRLIEEAWRQGLGMSASVKVQRVPDRRKT
jgi:NAD-dependent SIR2 family protein deacetylase